MGALLRVARGAVDGFIPGAGGELAIPLTYIKTMTFNGFRLIPQALDANAQGRLAALALAAGDTAPFHSPMTPFGRPMSVGQTSFGSLGWVSDAAGYRYAPTHPLTNAAWPSMPPELMELWARFAGCERTPDSCLINLYRDGARMGLHVDADEADGAVPVVSISLGDTAIFRLGGVRRGDPTRTVRLASGDICVLEGPARRAYHGVDRVIAGSSRLIAGGGRLNLTLRRAQP
jgi:alkylated DNA repair protein (DNA oxidative demethylase)